MVWLRRVLWAVLGLVLLLGATGGYLLATFDPNRYKGELIAWVQTKHQRTLTLQGPMTLALWPRLHVRLEGVALSEHQRPEAFASMQSLDLAVQVMPLLHGRLRVGKVSADGVSLRYVRDAQGRSNIDDLIRPAPAAEPASSGQPLSFDVAGVALRGLKLRVEDAQSGVRADVDVAEFRSGRLSDGTPSDIAVDAVARVQAPQVAQLGVRGQGVLTPNLATVSATLGNLKLALDVQAAGRGQFKGELSADQVQWQGDKKAVQLLALGLSGAGQVGEGHAATQIEAVQVALQQLIYAPASQHLVLAGLDVQAKGQRGGQPLTAKVQWPSLDVQAQSIKGAPLAAQLKLGGPLALDLKLRSQAPVGSFATITVPGLVAEVQVQMKGQGGQRQFAGTVGGTLVARPEAGQFALEQLVVDTRITEPALQPLTLKARGLARFDQPGAATWQIQGDLNGNAFQTNGQAHFGSGVPSVQAQARFASLDLNRWLPAPPAANPASSAPGEGPSGGSAAGQDAPIDLSGLGAVNGRFDVSAEALAWRQHRLSQARVLAELAQGQLILRQLSGQAWGGRFEAQGQVASSGELRLSANAQEVDVLALLKGVAGKEILEGRGQVKLDVSTQGRSVAQWTSNLRGQGAMVLRDGAVRGINLAKSLREARAKLSGRSDAVQRAQQVEKTDFTELTATFDIEQGVARNRDLAAKSPFLRITGAGEVNLPQRALDYTVNATVTGTVKGQDGADIDALKGLTVPVRLAGPFDALDWKIAWSGVAIGSIQNTLKGQLDGQVKQTGDRLKDQLKAKLLGGGASNVAASASGASAPAPAPKDAAKQQLKDALKGLFR